MQGSSPPTWRTDTVEGQTDGLVVKEELLDLFFDRTRLAGPEVERKLCRK